MEDIYVYVVFENTIDGKVFWEKVEYGNWVRMSLMKKGIPENCNIKANFPTQIGAEKFIKKVA